MTTIITTDGDRLDEIISQHYGADALSATLASVLAANVGLAQFGNTPPAGIRIVLPDQSVITRRRPRLW